MKPLIKIKKTVRKLACNNPIAYYRRYNMRKKLINTNATLFVPSCLGGELLHDLGLQFKSPFINLMLFQTDFVKLVTNYDYYTKKEFTFYEDKDYPDVLCAKLDDIKIHFTHYKTKEEAIKKWKEREKRINWDNLFICCSDRDGLTRQEIESLANIKCKGIVVFTAKKEFKDIPYCLYIPECDKYGHIVNLQNINWPSAEYNFEKWFDWVKWFNEANGESFDVSRYSRV